MRAAYVFAACLLLTTICVCQATDQTHYRAEPDTKAVFSGVAGGSMAFPFERFERGHLLAWEYEASPSKPSILVFGRDGKLEREVVVWYPGAVRVNIGDVTITTGGRLIATGAAAQENGTITDFLAAVDKSGKMQNIVRTGPYVANFICTTGAEDTVWTFGGDRHAQSSRQHYSMLREYSMEKGLRSQLLDRATLPVDHLLMKGASLGDVGLHCTSSEVALHIVQTGQLIEHQLKDGPALTYAKLPKVSKDVRVTGYTMTDNGDLFASMAIESASPQTYGLFRLNKDNGEAQWQPANGMLLSASKEKDAMRILGSEGNEVVYLSNFARDEVTWAHMKKVAAK